MTADPLEREVLLLESHHEICNLMGRFSFLETAGMNDELEALFARKTADLRIEIADGDTWEGREGVARFFHRHEPRLAGLLIAHAMTTPRITIADDGRSAEGRWVSPGAETLPNGAGRAEASWVWSEYAVGFVREAGEWRIRHLTIFPIVRIEVQQ